MLYTLFMALILSEGVTILRLYQHSKGIERYARMLENIIRTFK